MPPKKLAPAALGGLFIGILSALPLVNLGNLCCCLWVVGGGYLAAYLMQQDHPFPITTIDGAVVGFLAAMFGAVFFTLASIPIDMLMGPLQAQLTRWLLSRGADLPPGMRELLENMPMTPGSIVLRVVGQFVMMLIVGAIFATVGGILGALFSRRPPAPPAYGSPAPPPTAPPSPTDTWPPPQP